MCIRDRIKVGDGNNEINTAANSTRIGKNLIVHDRSNQTVKIFDISDLLNSQIGKEIDLSGVGERLGYPLITDDGIYVKAYRSTPLTKLALDGTISSRLRKFS